MPSTNIWIMRVVMIILSPISWFILDEYGREKAKNKVDLFFAFTSVSDLLSRLRQQKTHFCLPTKVRFLNDVCLRQMMTASPNDVRCANDVCLTAHWANIASLRVKRATSYLRSKYIISPQAMHHLTSI